LTERESQYEQQIKNYQIKQEQLTRDLERMQSELTHSHEDKLSIEKQANDSNESLKQDYERQLDLLKIELNKIQDQGIHCVRFTFLAVCTRTMIYLSRSYAKCCIVRA
jgi:hypothetical protein